jgi:hypothetical protein
MGFNLGLKGLQYTGHDFLLSVLLSVHTITLPFCEAKHTEFAIIVVFLGVDILFILFPFSEFI